MTATTAVPPPDASLLAQMVDSLLADVSAEMHTAVLLSAVPRWFTRTLLAQLLVNQPGPNDVIAALQARKLVTEDSDGRFAFSADVRAHLLAQARRLPAFSLANRQALAHFTAQAAQAPAFATAVYRRECLYHQIVLDERTGLRGLLDHVEDNLGRHQNGPAQDAVNITDELAPYLSANGRAWRRYLHARMDLVYRRGRPDFDALSTSDIPLIAVLAQWHLGQIHLARDNWTLAIQACQQSCDLLQAQAEVAYAGRVMLTLGAAYLSLAQSCGGIIDVAAPRYGRFNQLLDGLQHGPFYLYRALLARTAWFPRRRYIGTNYQDWIIAFLLRRAGSWYQQAADLLARSAQPAAQVDALIALAEVELATGRPALAAKRLDALLQCGPVRDSPYRTACIYQCRGEVLLAQQRPLPALDHLHTAANIFAQFQETARLAATRRAIGRAYALLRDTPEAVHALRQSLTDYGRVGDRLTQTQVAWQVAALDPAQADALTAELPERHYIARFSDALLTRFRRLALLRALPVSYVAGLFIALAMLLSLAIVESVVRVPVGQVALLAVRDLFTLALGVLLPLPLGLWLYRLFYTLMGARVIHDLGAAIKPFEREQPDRIVTDPDGLTIYSGARGTQAIRPWTAVSTLVTTDYCLRQRPIHLISRTFLVGANAALPLEGVTAGYRYLPADLAQRRALPKLTLNFRILGGWSMAAALLLSLLHAVVVVFVRAKVVLHVGLANSSLMLPLHFSSLMVVLVPTLWLLLPAVTLARLLHHRRRLARTLGREPQTVGAGVLWLGLGVTAVLALAWMLLLLTITL